MKPLTAKASIWRIFVLFSTIHSVAGASTPCHLESYVNEAFLVSVVQSKDARTLKEHWVRTPVRDLVSRIFYYTRLMELAQGKEVELGLLETLPSSQIEFDFLYSVNDTKAWQTSTEVSRVYAAYFEQAARQVVRHPEYAVHLLQMSRFADGEAKNFTDQANGTLRQLNPEAYLNGLRSLDVESRRYVCGECPELKQKS